MSGLLEEGETYESNIIKEAKSEIGLTLTKFTLGPKMRESDRHEFFAQYFFATILWIPSLFSKSPRYALDNSRRVERLVCQVVRKSSSLHLISH